MAPGGDSHGPDTALRSRPNALIEIRRVKPETPAARFRIDGFSDELHHPGSPPVSGIRARQEDPQRTRRSPVRGRGSVGGTSMAALAAQPVVVDGTAPVRSTIRATTGTAGVVGAPVPALVPEPAAPVPVVPVSRSRALRM